MSALQYSVYPGFGELAANLLGYSQAVRVGDRIECSGQGGWLPSSTAVEFPGDVKEEIDRAFENVELCLKNAGGKGWEQVFRINSYHTDLTPEVTERMSKNFKKWMPNHKPIWTQIGVAKLGADGMNVEIEVSAYDPQNVGKE